MNNDDLFNVGLTIIITGLIIYLITGIYFLASIFRCII